MRKIFLFMNVSLDGYFEAPNHDISGFVNDSEAFSQRGDAIVDGLLFGHRTYEMMRFWGTPMAREQMPEVAAFMSNTQKYVASQAPFEPGWDKVTVLDGDAVAKVKALREGPGHTIAIFGSNNLCISLMAAGLIDEYQIVVNPVAFGDGTPLFKGIMAKAPFRLASTQAFKSGAVLLTYTKA